MASPEQPFLFESFAGDFIPGVDSEVDASVGPERDPLSAQSLDLFVSDA
jgi:hypothetical protein